MRGMGAPDPAIERARADWQAQQPEHPHIVVFPENIPAIRLLLASADYWETPGAFGGRLTLPPSDIESLMRLLQIPASEEISLRVLAAVRVARSVKVEQFNSQARKS